MKIGNYNNIYMFKNPIRHFIDINKFRNLLDYNNLNSRNLSWSLPIAYPIRKYYGKEDSRVLNLPNIVNFFILCNKMENETTFPELSDNYFTRMTLNLETGDFPSATYKCFVEKDLEYLVKFEYLVILDIKSFYNSINTHKLQEIIGLPFDDLYIRNLNEGKSSGLLKGPLTSLYLADAFLYEIIQKFYRDLTSENINFKLEYFSDDVYLFINSQDIREAKRIFSKVLDNYDLQTNEFKYIQYDYLTYTKWNIVDKYWNTVIRDQKNYEKLTDKAKIHFNFINQLIYRKQKLNNNKLESIFMTGFFKSKFFIDLDISKYVFKNSDLHKLAYIYREHPETLLYTINKFRGIDEFTVGIKKFLMEFFEKSLNSSFFEEQMYYYYALKCLYNNDFLSNGIINRIIYSNNQVLISYIIMDKIIDSKIKDLLVKDEKKWFLNYHILLRIKIIEGLIEPELINDYLIPTISGKNKDAKRTVYSNFYLNAINNNFTMINENPSISISRYIELKKHTDYNEDEE
ncbi:MAG: hypothetical protein RBQ97_11910 [Acholeplasma sp.]|nr:hypothetical protein [Acholeplasma sp.]